MKRIYLLLILLSLGLSAYSQEGDETSDESRHRIMVVLGHTHVPEAIDSDGNKAWTILGSWGLDYDYRLTDAWSIGLHSDLVLESFVVEDNEGTVVERSHPLAVVLAGSHKWGQHFSLVGGVGREFAKEEDLTIVRVGADYGWELAGDWEVAVSLMADFKIDSYNAWVLGIGIGKLF